MPPEQRALDTPGTVVLLILAALTVMLYWPALGGPLLLDDSIVVAPLLRAAERGHDWRSFLFSDSGPLGRPLAMASFIINAQLSLDLRYWKATNLVLHLANGALLYALCASLARAGGRRGAEVRLLALAATALWLLHPLNISTVMYLSQRMTEWAALFGLLAMLLYAEGRRQGADSGYGRLLLASAWLICTPLAALGKETGLLTPFYLLALELCVFRAPAYPRPRWLRAVLFATTALPLLAAIAYFSSHWQSSIAGPYSLREFTPVERLLTEARVLLAYLGWVVMPRRAALGFFHDDVAIAHWPPDGATLLAIAALTALVLLAWRARRRAPLAAFGVLLFFVGHALESSVFALELVFEHRNYVPAIGICLALAALCAQWLDVRRAGLVLGALALLYGLVSAGMTPSWGNEGALYASFLRDHPDSRRARATLVEWSLGRQDLAGAERALGDAQDVSAQLHRLRIACLRTHQGTGAATALGAAAAMPRPDDMAVQILLWLAAQVQDGGCALESGMLVRTIETLRDRPLPHNSRLRLYVSAARLRHARGEQALALQAAEFAAQLVPGDPYPLYLAVEIALDAGDLSAARRLLAAARQRVPLQHEDFSRMDAALAAALETAAPPP